MSESPISLRDETGIERFRGTQSPGGGSLPQGWTDDGGNPASVATNGGSLDLGSGQVNNAQLVGAQVFNAQGASIGGWAVTLEPIDSGGPCQIVCGAADPSAGAGVDQNPGSLYLRNTGELWVKTGGIPDPTGWTKVTLP